MVLTDVARALGDPLETYIRAQESAGFMIQALRELALDSGPPSMNPGAERWRRIPVLLTWRAIKT